MLDPDIMPVVDPQKRKVAKYWWFALPLLCVLPCLTLYTCAIDPKAVVTRIPIGSKLSELNQHLGSFYEDSSVQEWGNTPTPTKATKYMKAKYGFSYVRELGKYDHWTASQGERDAFTGAIVFYHFSSAIPEDLAPSLAVTLVYIDGVLKYKDYGHLPG